jgi:hypothetical protein
VILADGEARAALVVPNAADVVRELMASVDSPRSARALRDG